MSTTLSHPSPAPFAPSRPVWPSPRRRTYQVSYRLKLAHLRYGRVVSTYFVPCTRRFGTDELNVILAELYEEVGPATNLLGIEILHIRRLAQLVGPAGSP